jgi:hypothetical protein
MVPAHQVACAAHHERSVRRQLHVHNMHTPHNLLLVAAGATEPQLIARPLQVQSAGAQAEVTGWGTPRHMQTINGKPILCLDQHHDDDFRVLVVVQVVAGLRLTGESLWHPNALEQAIHERLEKLLVDVLCLIVACACACFGPCHPPQCDQPVCRKIKETRKVASPEIIPPYSLCASYSLSDIHVPTVPCTGVQGAASMRAKNALACEGCAGSWKASANALASCRALVSFGTRHVQLFIVGFVKVCLVT